MSEEARELNFELYFATEVLGLPSLHYGFWEAGSASGHLDLDELRDAQVRFTEELVSAIPQGVESVLDVGAGIGDSALEMAHRGYEVTAISPDQNHEQYFLRAPNPRLHFHRSAFEDFESDSQFDLLYFSESINYFDREVGLRQSRRLVKPGGHLLVSGMFFFQGEEPFPEDFDLADLEYVRQAESFGFELVEARDFTRNVLPTVHMAHRALTDHLPPLLRMVETFLRRRTPLTGRLLGWILSPSRKRMERSVAEYQQKMDPEYFATHIRYATLLLRAEE
jgi:MPBQ/MSBQ methyltransferase